MEMCERARAAYLAWSRCTRTGDDPRWHDLSGSRVVRGAFWVSSAGVQPLAHALQRASNARRDVDIVFMIETHVYGRRGLRAYSSRSDLLGAWTCVYTDQRNICNIFLLNTLSIKHNGKGCWLTSKISRVRISDMVTRWCLVRVQYW